MHGDPRRIQDIFVKVVDLPAVDRTHALDRECGDDRELRQRVEALLAAHDASGDFLKEASSTPFETTQFNPAAPNAPDSRPLASQTTVFPPSNVPGAVIADRYTLQQKIGEGGMGEVWVARQSSPVKRRVALKLIKAGMDSKSVITRFEQERQALALMDHPNIARVLDGGITSAGQPFFVMELVNGLPLHRFCDEGRLTPRERLELFVPICQAVQHAHQKGIIHRDLKPANILVTIVDGKPVPKVIDFGVAKATGGKLTDQTMSTSFGAVIGTLEYMSPEQAGFSGTDVDTRTDVYSLGVILYQLLTGLAPIEATRMKSAAMAEMIRIIQEQDPPRPSARLSGDRLLPSVAALRQTEPRKLMSLLRGELDWVVMKCLEKQRDRRYDTANGLARDIQRYLSDEPVEARPPSAGYRMWKFVRRNRGPVIAAGLVLAVLIAGLAGTAGGLFAANRALRLRNLAERLANERERARVAAENERNQKEAARAVAENALYFNRVNAAAQYWRSGDWVESRHMLDLCSPGQRGWEWRYLDRLQRTSLKPLPSAGQHPEMLQLSADGRRLAALCYTPTAAVRIWDLARGTLLTEIRGPRTCCALSLDGATVAIGDRSGAVSFWDAQTGQRTREFAKLSASVSWLSFRPDGRWLAAACAEPRNGESLLPFLDPPRNEDLVVWEIAGGTEVFHPKGFGFVAAFSPDGAHLLTFKKNYRAIAGSPETSVALFDTSNWSQVGAGRLGSVTGFAFSASGRELALAEDQRVRSGGSVRMIDTTTGADLGMLPPLASDVALGPDGSTLAISKGLGPEEVEIWDWKARRQLRTLRVHAGSVTGMIFTPDGRLISCCWDGAMQVCDPAAQTELRHTLAPTGVQAIPAVLAPGGRVLAYAQSGTVSLLTGPSSQITLVNLETDPHVAPPAGIITATSRTLAGNDRGTVALAFSGDGRLVASGGRTGGLKTWDVTTLGELATYHRNNRKVAALAVSPDGKQVASAQEPPQQRQSQSWFNPAPVAVDLWDAVTGRQLLTLDHHARPVRQLAFSPDGRRLASTGEEETVIWDLASGKVLRQLDRSEFQSAIDGTLTFGHSGNVLATAGNQIVQLWDVESGHSVAAFRGHELGTLTVAISPDESRVASSSGRQVKIWDARTGLEAISLSLPAADPGQRTASVAALAWSDDGQRLRAALRDGSVVEWDAAVPAEPLETVRTP